MAISRRSNRDRRSTVSATAPPTMLSTSNGTSSARPSRPTASEEWGRVKTSHGNPTVVITLPVNEMACPNQSSRKSRDDRSGVRSMASARRPMFGGYGVPATAATEFTPARPAKGSNQREGLALGVVALLKVHVELALDALQGVVDRLHVPAQLLADLLVRLALHVEAQDVDLEARQHLAHRAPHVVHALGGDHLVGRIGHVVIVEERLDRTLARVVGAPYAGDGHVLVERLVLL